MGESDPGDIPDDESLCPECGSVLSGVPILWADSQADRFRYECPSCGAMLRITAYVTPMFVIKVDGGATAQEERDEEGRTESETPDPEDDEPS